MTKLFACALLFLPMIASAQYTTPPVTQITATNNDSGCTSTDCWNEIGTHGGSIAITSASMASDATIFVSDTACTTYYYNFTNDSFTPLVPASNGVCTVAGMDFATVYGLGNYNGSTNIYMSNSGAAWQASTSLSNRWSALAVGADGTVCAISSVDGNLYAYFPGTSAWTHIGNAAGSISACLDATDISYVDTSNVAWSYAGTPYSWNQMATGVVQYSPGLSSLVFVLPSGIVQTLRGSTWTTIEPPASGTLRIFGQSGLFEYALSGTNVYHLNSFKLSAQSTTSGNYAHYCQVVNPPACVGATHTLTHNLHFGSQAGTTGQAQGPPVNQLSATGQDTTVVCDPLIDDSLSQCAVTDNPIGNCSNMGPLNVTGGATCRLSPVPHSYDWKRGQTVHVYFDQSVFTQYCPANWCFLFNGISSWDYPGNPDLIHYENDGWETIQEYATCNNAPSTCLMKWPWMFVTQYAKNGALTGVVDNTKYGQDSLMLIGPDYLSCTYNMCSTVGAHEEAHHHHLSTCLPGMQGLECSCSPSQTVMTTPYDSSQPTTPSGWDALWSGIFGLPF